MSSNEVLESEWLTGDHLSLIGLEKRETEVKDLPWRLRAGVAAAYHSTALPGKFSARG
jgi:hypothetical protein